MSSLPPDVPNTAQPDAEDGERVDSAEAPRWAVPAVPPPWAGTAQAATGPAAGPPELPVAAVLEQQAQVAPGSAAQPAPAAQPGYPPPGYGQPGYPPPGYGQPAWAPAAVPAVARKPLFDRQKWLPTVVVAAIIAAVVLGGIGLDKVIADPSAGTVDVGNGVTITAAPGWVRTDDGSVDGVVLQKANDQLTVQAVSYTGSASAALHEVEDSISSETAQVSFTDEQDGTVSGFEAAMAGFEAVVSGPSGSGTVDGEIICLIAGDNAVVFEAVTPQGGLYDIADDVKAMVSSVEVGQ
jgi:hypothetical protein